MKKLGWKVAIAGWLYSLTAVFLYIHFGSSGSTPRRSPELRAAHCISPFGASLKGLGQGQKNLGGYLAGMGPCTVGNRKIPQQKRKGINV